MNPHHSEEQESVKPPTQPRLCANGCGFFANPACSDLCSKCYRDSQARAQADAAAKAMANEVATNMTPAQLKSSVQHPNDFAEAAKPVSQTFDAQRPEVQSSSVPVAPVGEDETPQQKNHNRCFQCNKRVGYTGFSCRCGYTFCSSHRYAEKHNCTFDFKSLGRERLAENNPQVVASKVDKI
uniref:Zinc finger a20 and an1 domain-containing stress-associated protein 7 n=1 Tax=Tetraselmis sp. GSL018 TaxID=582737 RepID=A0A061RPA7_9CHLO|mmetsp:Transcript_1969/g.4632  ORF Transcript_1969/g.4632 Transcript_1969/m.4632 type:complete len:182 (+) Transcript_1969:279-824(+)|eukprot:CAMPEP_0177592612 /NCGR_PEP_ID=MMETSP0419_2-20121207/8659_1 /TAXON_ID=582737 /ORGANISM="Tetraselmis sp., Strain GSL018" /LENGTH=181 /DNA_ID=CAMNT_0019083503 /DNA_START=254 /DNA_END=799 /DNA_ORIENTATION=+